MRFLILTMICAFFCVTPLSAKMIHLESQLSVTTKKNTIDISIKISNTGSATAYDIVTRIHFLEALKESRPIHQLSPNLSETITMVFDLQKSIKGHYPLIVEIQFHDMNLYPFYSLRCTPISIKHQKQVNTLTVHVPQLKMSAQNTIDVHVKNQNSVNRNICIQMIVSRAFLCEKNTHFLVLPKNQSAEIDFCILKKNALPATTHNGYIIITYKENAVSYAQVTPFNIYIKPVDRLFLLKKDFIAKTCLFFGLLWMLFVTYVSYRKKT